MTRTAVPYAAPDLSALARSLERALADHQITHGRLPGHVEMMNLLARGAGKRNLQELQADAAPRAERLLVRRARAARPGHHAQPRAGRAAPERARGQDAQVLRLQRPPDA